MNLALSSPPSSDLLLTSIHKHPFLPTPLTSLARLLYTKLPLLVAGAPGTCYLSVSCSSLVVRASSLIEPPPRPSTSISTRSATYFHLGTTLQSSRAASSLTPHEPYFLALLVVQVDVSCWASYTIRHKLDRHGRFLVLPCQGSSGCCITLGSWIWGILYKWPLPWLLLLYRVTHIPPIQLEHIDFYQTQAHQHPSFSTNNNKKKCGFDQLRRALAPLPLLARPGRRASQSLAS